MTTITSAPRKEITAKRSVRPIGGDMDEGFGEIDRYSQNEMSPKGRDLVEKTSIVRIPLPDRGQVTGIGRGIEVSYKPLETPSSTQSNYEQPSGHTKVPDAIARGLADVNFDLISAVTSDIKKDVMKVSKKGFGALLKGVSDFFTVNFQSVKEAATSLMKPAKKEKPKSQAEQKTEAVRIENKFIRQQTTQTEQMTSSEAKKRMQETASSIVNGQLYTQQEAKTKGYQEAYRVHTAVSIARERSEKIAAQKRKRYGSGIGSPAKKEGSRGPKRSTDNTAMQEGNSAVGGSGGDNTA